MNDNNAPQQVRIKLSEIEENKGQIVIREIKGKSTFYSIVEQLNKK